MDQEQLEILKRYCNPKPGNTLDVIANDLGLTVKEMKAKVRSLVKQLVEEYEVMKGLR